MRASVTVTEALVSGSLGQAVYREAGDCWILDSPCAEPREARPNDFRWFRHAAREVAPVDPEGSPVSIERVRHRLQEEIRFFNGLDGLLVGMDRDFSVKTRTQAIARAEAALAPEDNTALRIRERFLIPVKTAEWDPAGGLKLAGEIGAKAAERCYRRLADGKIERLADAKFPRVHEEFGHGVDAAHKFWYTESAVAQLMQSVKQSRHAAEDAAAIVEVFSRYGRGEGAVLEELEREGRWEEFSRVETTIVYKIYGPNRVLCGTAVKTQSEISPAFTIVAFEPVRQSDAGGPKR